VNQIPIYLLDDDLETLALLKDALGTADLNGQCFQNAKAFFDSLDEFDKGAVLILDLNMPDMDGIEVIRCLSIMTSKPNLILMSGHDVGVLHSAEKLCCAHGLEVICTLNKPIHVKEFLDIINRHIALQSSVINKPEVLKRIKNEICPQALYNAIINDELVLHYQPKIDIESNMVIGSEALVRWQHPQQGLIFPDQFIAMTEQQGWMDLLTKWVINQAASQQQKWQKQNFQLPVSVNISAGDVTSLTLPEQLATMLADKTLNPAMLYLEITESALMGELVTSLDILTRLRLKGIGLSIDDFGTGYSSLSQLHRIPFTELKIDCSFIMSMLLDDEARAIVKTCIILGHELGMQVVAEGLESQAHLTLLRQMSCDMAQGYFFSKALPAVQFFDYVQAFNNKNNA
jgi:EAL domain-containing protein (putative c-di-GMP-specific phosphodiesterase class I)/FixJ family two-component response regulator